MIKEKQASLEIFPVSDIENLKSLLSQPRKIVITTHRNPDGDAMGSSLGLSGVLKKLGHWVTVLTPNPYDYFLHWMPNVRKTVFGDRNPGRTARILAEADIIFCLDYGALKRVNTLAEGISKSKAVKVMVDHHLDPEDFAELNFHVAGMSSTAEIVYRMVLQLGYLDLMDKAGATCLYVGLMTDTGSFRFSSTTADVHRIVAALLDFGIDVGHIHNSIYDNFSEPRTRFLGYVLNEKLKILPEYKTAYMTVSLEEIERFKLKSGDTEGFVNYNLSLRGIHFGVLLKESTEGTKLSLRSIGQFPCNDFAGHFGGGGHHNASGGRIDLSLEDTEKKFLELLEVYKDQLDY